ncbi:MAG: PASTA domain-containing protein [bacterium]
MTRPLLWLAAAAAAFVTGLAIFHFGMLAFVHSGAESKVPDLVGLTVAEARVRLEEAGFKGVEERQEYSLDFGEGVVSGHRPASGMPLRHGRKVWLTVSLGLRRAPVPNVAGMSYRQAGIALERGDLSVGSVARVHHDSVPRGSVIAQDPPAAAPLPEGARVDLLVSLGPDPREWIMPDLTGRLTEDVEADLTGHGLRVGAKTVLLDRAVLPGTVLEQDPPPGRKVEAGTRVDLVVSSRH